MTHIELFRCPVSFEDLQLINIQEAPSLPSKLEKMDFPIFKSFNIRWGLVNSSREWFYPIIDDIALLLPQYAIQLKEEAKKVEMSFDKKRVFRYYNEIEYISYEEHQIYEDSAKWVDYRPVSREYIEHSFLGAKKYLNEGGQFYLDVASGPIGLKEYLELSEGYEYRICIDLSFPALQQAKRNYKGKGIYVCGDITNLPMKDNVCDAVLSQHTVYHVPKNEQRKAVEELYRVAKPGHKVAIVYSWFYHSPFMNIALFPVQLYRIARHFTGKLYVRLFSKKPRLYFHAHGKRFFKKMPFGDKVKFYAWRSVNKYFLNIYVHKGLGGKKLLKWIQRMEEKHPEFMGRFGEYPIIIIEK